MLRLARRREAHARLERRHATLAWARLGLLFVGVALLLALGSRGAPWLAIPIGLFLPLAFVHARVLNERDRAARAAAYYERGLARLEHRWQGGGLAGDHFRDATHPYAEDLDLFGRGSLFELLATARTGGGEETLAAWLKAPAPAEIVRDRQRAAEELSLRLDLHEELAVLGPELAASVRSADLEAWAVGPPALPERWPRVVLPVAASVSTGLVIQWIWTGVPPPWLLPALGVQVLLAFYFRHRVHAVVHSVETREHELEVLAVLMARIEREDVESPLLQSLRAELRATGRPPGVPPAAEIKRLARLVDHVSSGHNLFFAPFSALLLLGTQLAFAVDRWRTRCGPAVPHWLRAVATFEAITAVATYRAEHPADPWPEIVDEGPLFEALSLAHPLLPEATAVRNNLALGGQHPQLLIVSGSNMSGKSTLLRTAGINVVLAQAGAPVRAERLRMSPLAIGATLRIQESLQEGRSRFFAEIMRISEIVALARGHRDSSSSQSAEQVPDVFFLFDELLSGTNSHDRFDGATGILTALVDAGAIGLATTHDLALTALPDRLGGPWPAEADEPSPRQRRRRAANVHFSDRLEDDVLHFDYKLRPGVVQTSNALALMRSVGLDV